MSVEATGENLNRRSFLVRFTTGLIGVGVLASSWPILRSLLPNVFYEPPRKFKVGDPIKFPEGVSFLEHQRVFLFREGNSFHAISAVCTHLGCTVKYTPFRQPKELEVKKLQYMSRGEFSCPCHGSKFRDEGTNFSGPAPRPLDWYELGISPADGQLVVDKARTVDRDFRLVV